MFSSFFDTEEKKDHFVGNQKALVLSAKKRRLPCKRVGNMSGTTSSIKE